MNGCADRVVSRERPGQRPLGMALRLAQTLEA
jgi:hypothetical protein